MQVATGAQRAHPMSAARRQRAIGKAITIFLFLLPSAVLFGYFVILPVVRAVYFSFFKWNGMGPLTDFVGLSNFTDILASDHFRRALSNNLFIMVFSLLVQLPLSLGLSLIVARKLKGRGFFRLIFFLPYVLSEVVTGLIWNLIYHPEIGLLNRVIQFVIPSFESVVWLGINTVMPALFAVITWKFFGFHLMLYVAGLQDIPAEIEEAALIDGATSWQATRFVTVPMLASTIRISVFLSVLGSLQFFDLVWVMTLGGPLNRSETMATYLIKYGFQRFALGYGSAVAVILCAMCLVFSLIYQRFAMRRDTEGALTRGG